MITISDLGMKVRLGNQLFQYAALRSVGIENNFEIKIPPYEKHSLGELNIHCNTLIPQDFAQLKYKYEETRFNFDKNIFTIKDNTDISGYFQSAKYFQNIKHILDKEFSFQQQVMKKANNFLLSTGFSGTTCSIHVRRGDYLSELEQGKHPVLPMNYFKRAMSFFPASCKFIVFSDDINWCKKNFSMQNIFFVEGNSPVEDLALMSLCSHNIIANSSFSWWGAWLNKNQNKIVIAPQIWFGTKYSHLSTKDLLPASWLKV